MKKLLVYSGGMDSTAALYIYKDSIELAVSFNYGSRHNEREIAMAAYNCEKLGIKHRIVNLTEVFTGLSSALLGTVDVPYGHYEDDSMKSTVVPFRNGVMLSIAVAYAEDLGIKEVMLASHAGDHAVYPDCRADFNKYFSLAAQMGTYAGVTVAAPFEKITKHKLCLQGVVWGMDIDKTYSCYEGGVEHCGKCGTCVERLEAIAYVADKQGEMACR